MKGKNANESRKYMVLVTPSDALVSFVRKGKKISDVLEYKEGKWIPDEDHADILETAARIGALRKMGVSVEPDEVKALMNERKPSKSKKKAKLESEAAI